jgi:hypothetical protein
MKPRAKPQSPRKAVCIYIPPALWDAMRRAARGNHRSLTGEVTVALEEYLRDLGKWPPEQGEPNDAA